MARPFQVDITARDKTADGVKSAEKRFERIHKPMDRLSRGLDRYGRGTGVNTIVGGLTRIAGAGKNAAGGLATAVEGAEGLGVAAGTASWALGGLVGGALLAGAAATKAGLDWVKAGGSLNRTAKGIGMAAGDLQKFRSAGMGFGVDAGAMDGALQSVGDTLNDAKWGRNTGAQAMMVQLGLRMKTTRSGAIDVKESMLDLADAIARQKNPQTQRKIAQMFGVEGALPLLRQGRAAVDAELRRSSSLSQEQYDAAEKLDRKLGETKAKWESLKGALVANFVIPWLDPLIDRLQKAVDWMARLHWAKKGEPTILQEAWARLTGRPPPRRAAPRTAAPRPAAAASGFAGFAQRIERQESRGRQLDAAGRPLTSSQGAIGVMQLLPETAQRVARANGIPWDANKFRYDAAYNRRLGQLHLQELLTKYGGSQVLAAAAYNAGEGRLDGPYKDKKGRWHRGWLERFGDPRKGQISEADFAAKIPFGETRDYVALTAGAGGMAAASGRAQVDVTFRGAPPGMKVVAQGDKNTQVGVKTEQAMADGPAL